MKRMEFKAVGILLALIMAFMPSVRAMVEARINGQPPNNDTKIAISDHLEGRSLPITPTSTDPIVGETPISIEIIKNTRELAIVRVNDTLITQVIDNERSTEDTTVAVLRVEDPVANTVDELWISVRYEVGQYITTFYEGTKGAKIRTVKGAEIRTVKGAEISTVVAAFDPLEPGALRNVERRNIGEDALHMQSQSALLDGGGGGGGEMCLKMWDDVTFICGITNPPIDFTRPDVGTGRTYYWVDPHETHILRTKCDTEYLGTRLYHMQLSRADSVSLIRMSVALFGVALGVIVIALGIALGPLSWPAIAAAFVATAMLVLLERDLDWWLKCCKGHVWVFWHRDWVYWWGIPIRPKLLRLGRITEWDHCPYTSWGPDHPSDWINPPDDPPEPPDKGVGPCPFPWPPYLRIGGSSLVYPIISAVEANFEALWPGTQVVWYPVTTGASIQLLQKGRIDIAVTCRRPDVRNLLEIYPHDLGVFSFARAAAAIIVNEGRGMAWLTNITRAQVRYIWEAEHWHDGGIAGLTWCEVDMLDGFDDGWPTKPVVPVAREIGSGMRDTFHYGYEAYLFLPDDFVDDDPICPFKERATIAAAYAAHGHGEPGLPGRGFGNPGIVGQIRGHDNRIGYVGLAWIDEPGIRAVKVENVMPSVVTVGDGTFPASFILYLVTRLDE